jgi:hypothetical protein
MSFNRWRFATLEETPWLAQTLDTTQRLPLRTDDPEP